MRRLAALGLAAALLPVAGCVFTQVSLEGRRCATTADCVSGYECSPELVCVLTPDVGRPDAGRPDAYLIDVGRDAPAPGLEAGLDAPVVPDAPGEDASMLDDVGPSDGGGGSDGGGEPDADVDAASVGDAASSPDAASATSDAGLDAAS